MNRMYLAVAIAAIAFPAYAQSPSSKTQGTAPSAATKEFVNKAAIGDMYEIQSSELAQSKAQNKEFQTFADQIIEDHTKSSNELKQLVQDIEGMQMPSKLDAKHQQMIDQLKSASADQFGQQYKKQQIEAHQSAVQLYSDYSKNGDHQELKSFAEDTLPALKEHLKMAQDLPEGAARVGQAGPNSSQKNMAAASTTQNQQQSAQTQQQSAQNQQQPAQNQQQSAQSRTGAQSQANVISTPGPDHILASDLEGTDVYGANNEDIGEISEVVLNRKGQVVAVVVGVGGFLGLGEKSVAIPFDAIEISEQAQGDRQGAGGFGAGTQQQAADDRRGADNRQGVGAGDRQQGAQSGTLQPQRIVLRGMTKEELEAAPAFESEGDRGGRQPAGARQNDQRQQPNQNR